MAVLQMAYAFLKDSAREADRFDLVRGVDEDWVSHEEQLDTELGFIYIEDDVETAAAGVADHDNVIDFLDYWNNNPAWKG
jgi:hypothetical protein